jgi:quercetin dioxygenase-like cupin family protein
MYILGLKPGKGTAPERHIYEEFFQVVEGYGTTEVWLEHGQEPIRFEWGEGTMFTVPRNAWHRMVCASPRGARIIASTNAPRILNAFGDNDFVFDNDYRFKHSVLDREESFRPRLDYLTAPNGRAMLRTNVVPDLPTMTLAPDGQRGVGTRRMQLNVPGSRMFVFANEYPVGRYSRAHYHPAGAVLICLSGKGYTLNWPRELGTRPWETGHGDKVERLDYVPGGFVAAAPGGGDWFHQHFGSGREPLRLLAVIALGHEEVTGAGRPDQEHVSINRPIVEGGHTIPYSEEDPHIRQEFARMLALDGASSEMPDSAYS